MNDSRVTAASTPAQMRPGIQRVTIPVGHAPSQGIPMFACWFVAAIAVAAAGSGVAMMI